ncbi:SDR family NAD(P)-dependent oxidoreductase [Epidermidibacterium keratini]|uniref:SDR family NAD(P)-dependent oxidoreductase n=1 Tax=Epidermidibacterium keratini TaxID=1891644 RepID=A0A7L4YLY0_9ACTN|nr:SDR family oxidoreductase [Epidermidibacterium keratini]QHB99882.1 SDR family NAD(P)-dependent oxidoreductase [Epidermidibacterium keratini]
MSSDTRSDSPVALVTGAGRGIGEAAAVDLSAAGYRIALTSRSRDQLEAVAAQCAGETLVIPGDITDPGFPDALVGQITDTWGRLDVLVANAGSGTSAPLTRTTDEQWQSMLDLNLTSVFRCVRAAARVMTAQHSGAIVIVASIAGRVGEPYISAYTASKHGVLGLMRSAAAELVGKGVRVNAVCPGYVDTPMTDSTVASVSQTTGRDPDEVRQTLADKQAHGKLITPGEVSDAIAMCVRNGGLNAQAITIDGGTIQA